MEWSGEPSPQEPDELASTEEELLAGTGTWLAGGRMERCFLFQEHQGWGPLAEWLKEKKKHRRRKEAKLYESRNP